MLLIISPALCEIKNTFFNTEKCAYIMFYYILYWLENVVIPIIWNKYHLKWVIIIIKKQYILFKSHSTFLVMVFLVLEIF